MICCIAYGSDGFREAAKLNAWSAIHKGKADSTRVFGPEDIPADFYEEHKDILQEKRGGGYWLWKPFFILKTLQELDEGDILCYCDSQAVYIKPIKLLIRAMEKENQDIMCFANTGEEQKYSKRDAFIALNCDADDTIRDSLQRLGGYILVRNSESSRMIIQKWLNACANRQINTDDDNVMGLPNYQGFVQNRHDQTAWSLVTKKANIPAFRDPSRRRGMKVYGAEVNRRSPYPIMIYNYHQKLKKYNWNEVKKARFLKLIKRLLKRIGKS